MSDRESRGAGQRVVGREPRRPPPRARRTNRRINATNQPRPRSPPSATPREDTARGRRRRARPCTSRVLPPPPPRHETEVGFHVLERATRHTAAHLLEVLERVARAAVVVRDVVSARGRLDARAVVRDDHRVRVLDDAAAGHRDGRLRFGRQRHRLARHGRAARGQLGAAREALVLGDEARVRAVVVPRGRVELV